MDGKAIVEAIELLHSTYPNDCVQLWVGYAANGNIEYVARVGDEYGTPPTGPNVYAQGQDPMDCARKAITEAGDRNPITIKQRRLAELQERVTKLQEEIGELVGETTSETQIGATETEAKETEAA